MNFYHNSLWRFFRQKPKGIFISPGIFQLTNDVTSRLVALFFSIHLSFEISNKKLFAEKVTLSYDKWAGKWDIRVLWSLLMIQSVRLQKITFYSLTTKLSATFSVRKKYIQQTNEGYLHNIIAKLSPLHMFAIHLLKCPRRSWGSKRSLWSPLFREEQNLKNVSFQRFWW